MKITSKDNPQLKELKKLQQKRFRVRRGRFAAEGEDLVAAALAAGWEPEALFCTPDAPAEFLEAPRAMIAEYDLLASATALGSGARVVAVFELPEVTEAKLGSLSLYAEGVSDPGNVGTLIRGASAFTDASVLLDDECADPYSPKALRAAMGATFAAPPVIGKLIEAPGTTILALDGSGEVDIREFDPAGPTIICAGGERDGLSDETLARADVVAKIPMLTGGPESLNVAMAATIALYELAGKLQPQVHVTAADGIPTPTEN